MSFNYCTSAGLMTVATYTLLLMVAGAANALKPLPEFIHVCKGNDPQLPACLISSVESLQPLMAAGIPAMNVPSVEPLYIGNLLVAERATAQGIQIQAIDIRVYNATQFKIFNMQVKEHGRLYTFDVDFPKMYVTGRYAVTGQILLIPINGSGPFNGRFKQVRSKNTVHFGRKPHEDGSEHIIVDKVHTKITVEGGKIELQNLFGGDSVLGDTINETINQNFLLFANDLMPLIEQALSKVFRRIGNQICGDFTAEQLFPVE